MSQLNPKALLVMAGVFLSSNMSRGQENPPVQHGSVAIKEEKAEKAENIHLQFVVLPGDGLKLSFEAPWKLELTEAKNLNLSKASFGKNELDQTLGAFKTTVELKEQKPQSLKYKLIAFICTKDATRCFRDVFEGQYTVK